MAIEWKKNDLPTLAQKVADDASETCQNFIYAGIDVELSDCLLYTSDAADD